MTRLIAMSVDRWRTHAAAGLLLAAVWGVYSARDNAVASAAGPTTWYVRPDGGTRQQCTGSADAPYPGTGANQPCAFNNPYWLWTDNAKTGDVYINVTTASRAATGTVTVKTAAPHGYREGQDVLVFTSVASFTNRHQDSHALIPTPIHVIDASTFTYEQSAVAGVESASGGTARSYASWRWIISGGDTVIIKNNADGSQAQYRMGQATSTGGIKWNLDADTGGFGLDVYMPPLPSGTASQPTRLLGEGYASGCPVKPQLFGSHGVKQVINLYRSEYADLECLDITDHAYCVFPGVGASPETPLCNYSEDSAKLGIYQRRANHFKLQDLFIHGLAINGIQGGHIDSGTVNRVTIKGVPGIGWNWDDNGASYDYREMVERKECVDGHDNTCSVNTGNFEFDRLSIWFSGCMEKYPLTSEYDYDLCTHMTESDGFALAISGGNWHFNHADFRYNQADNLDMVYLGHCIGRINGEQWCRALGPGTYDNVATNVIENSYFRTAGKGTLKSAGYNVTVRNTVTIQDCGEFWPNAASLGYPATIAKHIVDSNGQPAYCGSYSQPGRGESTAIAVYTKPGGQLLIQNNTVITDGEAIVYGCSTDYEDGFWDKYCIDNTLASARIENNLIWGIRMYRDGGTYWPLWRNSDGYTLLTNPGGARRNNLYAGPFGVSGFILNDPAQGATGELAADPKFVNDSAIYLIDPRLTSASPAIDAGVAIPGLSTDIAGETRPRGNGYDIGAYEFAGTPSTTTPPPTTPPPSPTPTPTPPPTGIPSPAGSRAVVSAQSGAWNTAATWVGGVIPGNGDTVTIANGHTVTIPSGVTVTVGSSPADDTGAPAIQCASATGSGVLAVNGRLVMRGPVRQCASWVIGPGATITHDSSLAATPSAAHYTWQQTGGLPAVLRINGGAGAGRVAINIAAGSGTAGGFGSSAADGGQIQGSYFDMQDWGPIVSNLRSAGAIFSLDHCALKRSGPINIVDVHRDATWSIDSCALLDAPSPATTITVDFCQIGACGAIGAGKRNFSNNVMNDGRIRLNGGQGVDIGMTFRNNVLKVPTGAYASLAPSSSAPSFSGNRWENNFFWQDRPSGYNNDAMHIPAGALNRTYVLSTNRNCAADQAALGGQVDNNLASATAPHNAVIDGWVVEVGCAYGAALINSVANGAAPWTWEVKNTLMVPDSAGKGMTLVVHANSAACAQTPGRYCATFDIHHNTFVGSYQAVATAGIASFEGGGYTGAYTAVRNNLVWQPLPVPGTVITAASQAAAPGSYSNVDYNWIWNLTNGGAMYRYNGTSAYTSAPGAHDRNGDPQFVDSTRNVLAWCVSMNPADTTLSSCFARFAAVASDEFDPRYQVASLIDYVRAGFQPSNGALLTAAHDGSHVGAVIPRTSGSVPAIPAGRCDLNGDGVVSQSDVSAAITQVLGRCTTADLTGDGFCTVLDVQRVINSALGKGCTVGQ